MRARPIIIVSHSMGGNVSLHTLLANRELLRGPVERLVTVQSPLKGTATAAFAYGMQSVLPLFDAKKTGAYSMLSTTTYALMKKNLESLTDADRVLFDRKVYYVATYSSDESTKLGTYLIKGANDGTVAADNAYLRTYGKLIAYLPNIGHTDLFLEGAKSGMTQEERFAFARALFTVVPESAVEDKHALAIGP